MTLKRSREERLKLLLCVDEKLKTKVKTHLVESAEVKTKAAEACTDSIIAASEIIAYVFRKGGKLLICGNGGSAADSQHLAAEFVSRLSKELERPALPALALTTDTSFITAYANDYDFDGVFKRQVEALGRAGDALLGISTSGNSGNIIQAMNAARQLGMFTVALTGAGGELPLQVDVAVEIPAVNTQYIQEAHLAVEHLLCELVEHNLFETGEGYIPPSLNYKSQLRVKVNS